MADYPTLGLKFDLPALREGIEELGQGRVAFKEVGAEAEAAAKRVKDQAQETKKAGDEASTAGQKRKRASDAATAAEKEAQRQIRATMAQLKLLNDIARAMQLEQLVRNRMRMVAGQQMVEAAADVRKGGLVLVTEVDNQSARVQAAVSRLFAPDALRGAERARMQTQLEQTFGAIEDTVQKESLQLVTVIDNQTARIQAAMGRLMAARPLAGLDRSRRQADLDAAFGAVPEPIRQPNVPHGWGNRGGGRGGGGSGGGSNFPGPSDGDRRGVVAYAASLVGLGGTYDLVTTKGGQFFKNLGVVRVALLNARFAAAVFIGALTLGPLASMADQMVALEARTRLYAKTASDVPYIMSELYLTAQRARQPLEGIATLYTRLAPLSDQLGKSQKDLIGIVETVSKAFSVGGASAAEATSSAQQLAQALASNRFGGDELRSVAENAPTLLRGIAEGVNQLAREGYPGLDRALNLNAGSFIKWAQAGNANAQIMVDAIERARPLIEAQFKAMPVTIGQSFTVLSNAFIKSIGDIDKAFAAANGGKNLSTEIAELIVQFANFIESKGFIDGVVTALTALVDVLQFVGRAIEFVVNGIVPLSIALAGLMLVTKLGPAFSALAFSIKVYGVSQTIATNATLAGTWAVNGLRAAWAALVAASPLIVLVAITAAIMFLVDAFKKGDDAVKNLNANMQGLNDAVANAISFAQKYGKDTAGLVTILERQLGIQRDANDTTDAATRLAQARADMEKKVAIAQIEQSKATLRAAAADARKSASIKRVFAAVLEGAAAIASIPGGGSLIGLVLGGPVFGQMLKNFTSADVFSAGADALKAEAAELEGAAKSYEDGIAAADAALALVRAMDVSATTAEARGDRETANGDGDKDKNGRGMNSAINQIAKLRAEVKGLNDQIDALNVNPLSDIAARIRAAAEEAGAARTAGPGAVFQNEAQRLAALKEEASIRLDLTRSLVEQERAARNAADSTLLGMAADRAASKVMEDFWSNGERSAAGYADALRRQAQVQTDAEKAQAELAIAQTYGVTTVDEIAAAYKDVYRAAGLLTDETAAYADSLQLQAQATLDAEEAAIDEAKARERMNRALEAGLQRREEIGVIEGYVKAVEGGVRALQSWNREEQIRLAMAQAGDGADLTKVTDDVDRLNRARYNAMIADRERAAQESAIDVTLTGAERERGLREQILAYMLAYKDATIEQAKAAVEGATKEADLRARMNADIVKVSDDIRRAFIDSGKLDFTSLKDTLTKRMREAVYDALLAKPIDMVVNAAVNWMQKGIDTVLQPAMNWAQDNVLTPLLQAAGPWGQAAALALVAASSILGKERVTDNRDVKRSAEETQKLQGTGSVLGMPAAQSRSLLNALEYVRENTAEGLEYSNSMLRALLNIEAGIGGLTNAVARQLSLSAGAFDTSGLGIGTTSTGPGLLNKLFNPISWILPGLFGSTSNTSLQDQGISFGRQSVGSILSGGVQGSTYQDIMTNTVKKFLGVTYSNKTRYSTVSGALDSGITGQINMLIGSLKEGAIAAAEVFGVTGAGSLLDNVMVDIGRISFKDMDADQIQAALNAVFSKVADDMAIAVLPIVTQFQQAGEGAFETLARIAQNYQAIDAALATIGRTFGAVGVSSIEARERLIALFGGLDEFMSKTQFFADNFFTDAEKLATVRTNLNANLTRLGLSSIQTREQFRMLVQGIDITTEGGAALYAELLNLAPAFVAVTEEAEKTRAQLKQIFEYAQGLLTSNLSPLSPQEQLGVSQREFERLLALAQGGDRDALDRITDASGAYLEQAQRFFASSPEYAAIFDRVYQALMDLSAGYEDPVVTALREETQRLIDVLNRGFGLTPGNDNDLPGQDDVVTGGGGGGGGSGGGGGGGDYGFDPILYDRILERYDQITARQTDAINQQLAAVAEAVVKSTDDGADRMVDATTERSSMDVLLNGGTTRQSRAA